MTIEPINDEIEILPAARPVQASAATQLRAHVQAMSEAKILADALCDTDMVPATYRGKPGNGAAAILYGAELGLNPIQSLQHIFVVHGTPAIYARTAVALLKRHGIKFFTVEESPTSVTIRAQRGEEAEESTWTLERAKTAGFVSNRKYQTEPQAMLWAKAAMEVSRRIAPDILLGIGYSTEEMELSQPQQGQQQARPVQSQRPTAVAPRRGVEGLRTAITPKPARPVVVDVEPEPEPEPEPQAPQPAAPAGMTPATRKKWVASMFAALAEADCNDREDQLIVITELAQRRLDPPEHRDSITDDELRMVVNALNAARKDSALGPVVTDILNAAALREAGEQDSDTGEVVDADDLFSAEDTE
jgi:hypothetical protein